ncbi:MAG: response regulator, partial [Myxococcales bacterium]|nr:response regulator [Myxococcales bacterium]
VRTLMGVIVDALGCAYDEARNGAEAIERMRSREYAVVLMDIQMPVLGGIAALRQIRQTPGLDRAYVVALTACALQDERAEIFAAGFDACLMKPIDLAELRALIRGRVGDQPAPDPDPA